jgi:hypothetical protein
MNDSNKRVRQLLENAKRIALTDEENTNFAVNPSKMIAQISERTGIPLSSGRVAHAPALKCLLVVD